MLPKEKVGISSKMQKKQTNKQTKQNKNKTKNKNKNEKKSKKNLAYFRKTVGSNYSFTLILAFRN